MKRVLFAVTGTVLGLVAILSFKTKAHPLTSVGALPQASVSTSSGTPRATGHSAGPPRRPTGSSTPATVQTAKTYVGQAVQTYYGVVQVQVNATGKHIDSVQFVKLTAYDGTSQQINSYAAPILAQETVSAQSAHIDTVSGATYTSQGYLQSLQSALDQAGI
jgi:uncharacterized protein with FMN-binding domain